MPNYDQYQGLVNALELKHALVETNQRAGFQRSSRQSDSMPIITRDGEHIATIPKNAKTMSIWKNLPNPGVLIELEGSSDVGLVIEAPTGVEKQAVYVRPLSKDETKDYITNNPTISRIQLTKDDLVSLKPEKITKKQETPKVLDIYNPIQKAFFWAFKESYSKLKHNQRDQSIFIDKILWFYLGLVTMALLILIIMYWHGSN